MLGINLQNNPCTWDSKAVNVNPSLKRAREVAAIRCKYTSLTCDFNLCRIHHRRLRTTIITTTISHRPAVAGTRAHLRPPALKSRCIPLCITITNTTIGTGQIAIATATLSTNPGFVIPRRFIKWVGRQRTTSTRAQCTRRPLNRLRCLPHT